MFGNIFNSVVSMVDDAVSDPIGTAINVVTQPIVDGCDLLQGLTEGEFREKAALRLGADIAFGVGIGELIDLVGKE